MNEKAIFSKLVSNWLSSLLLRENYKNVTHGEAIAAMWYLEKVLKYRDLDAFPQEALAAKRIIKTFIQENADE